MNLRRWFAHLVTSRGAVARVLPEVALERAQRAIEASEASHRGELRFAVEAALDPAELLRGLSARERALQVFSELRVWDTAENNGVLIYVLLADKDFEIIGDRGIHAHVGPEGWEAIARRMEALFRAGEFERAILQGVEEISEALRRHFPRRPEDVNELPDRPVIL